MDGKKFVTESQTDLIKRLKIIKVRDKEYVIQLKKVPDEDLTALIEIARNAKILFLRIEPEDIPRLEAKHIFLNAEEFNSYFYCSTIAEAPIELLEKYGIQRILVGSKNNESARKMGIETYRNIYAQLKAIVADIPSSQREERKFRKVYERLANRMEYDYEAIRPGTTYAKENENSCRNLENAVLKNKAVCVGFAETLKQTLSLIGIESILVYSVEDKDGGSHAYNLVKLHDQWYNADLTWDYKCIRKKLRPRFCLKSDKDFTSCEEKDKIFHIPEDITTPKCERSIEVFKDYKEEGQFIRKVLRGLIHKIKMTKKLGQAKILPLPDERIAFRETIKTKVTPRNTTIQKESNEEKTR